MATETAPRTPAAAEELQPNPEAGALIAEWRSHLDPAESERHETEPPELEDAFRHLAIDHPDAVEASNRRPEVAALTETYTTEDGRTWDLRESYTAAGFHYLWDGMPYGASGPQMVAVGRPGMFAPLERLAMLDLVGAEGAVPDHRGDSAVCTRCRVLRGEAPQAPVTGLGGAS